MANFYVSSVKWAAITPWAASTAYTVGQYRRQLAAVANANGRVFKCTTAGTSGASEPTWVLSNNGTTNDGTVVWTQVGGQEAEQLTGDWRAALPTLAAAQTLALSTDLFVFVASDHNESVAAALAVAGAATSRVCVAAGSTIPPTAAEVTTGAVIETTGNNALTLSMSCYFRGFHFKSGTGATTSASLMAVNGSVTLENCILEQGSTHADAHISFGSSSTAGSFAELINTSIVFGQASQQFRCGFSEVLWRDTPSPLGGAIIPTNLLNNVGINGARTLITLRNLDLSTLSTSIGTVGLKGQITLESCKIHPSLTVTGGSVPAGQVAGVRLHNCDDGTGAGNALFERGAFTTVNVDPSVIRTGGATDGVNPVSWSLTLNTSTQFYGNKLSLPRIAKRVNLSGSRTFTIEALIAAPSGAPLPPKGDIYVEYSILDNAGSPVAGKYSTRSGPLDLTAQQASTADWSTGQPLRTNSTSRPLGYMFSVASSPGRVFRVLSSGTTAASEPAAYATAVDGDTITDGSCVVRAMYRVKFEVTATPARKGVVFAKFNVTALTTYSIWLDPKIGVV